MINRRKFALLSLGTALAALAGCMGNPGPIPPPKQLISYFEAKKDLADALQLALGGTTGSTTYRLVPINGPAYQVGALIPLDNTLDLESRACQFAPGELPQSERWNNLPTWTSGKTLDLGLGIPAPMHGMMSGAESSLAAGVKWDNSSSFGLTEISQVFLSRSDLRDALARPKCAAAIKAAQGGKAIFVRGIIYGQEELNSTRLFSGNLGVRVVSGESALFKLKYDNRGAFELSETKPTPKFAIIAEVAAPPLIDKSLPTSSNPIDIETFPLDGSDPYEALFAAPDSETLAKLQSGQ